ncbi:MAG: vitamin K epoxide reductase family protein, partial [Nanoarchaeota archaeon]|nr:vitamin K epoxide reductase family protein [Nanoarchaeota archaeon]
MQKKYFIIILLILSIVGLVTSLSLTYSHYNPSLKGGVCDITASVSCTVVNSGIYSTIVGIPVAVYGVVWFLILGTFSWKSRTEKKAIPKLLGWNILGMVFVFYFVYIEYVLGTICPFCTVVHVLVALSLVMSILLYKQFY